MSSNVAGDAQPDAAAEIEAEGNKTSPTEIVDNSDAAGGNAGPAQEQEAEEEAAEEEAAEEPAPDEPTGATDSIEPADVTEPAESPEPAELTDPADVVEPTALIEMTEPVEMAEPVDEPEPRRRWRGLLLSAGFVIAALAIIGGAFAIVGSLTHGFKKPVIITYKKSAIFSLRTGECINPNGQAAAVVACTTPHTTEVFATFTLPDSAWPGTSGVRAAASSGCASRLTAYLNPQLAISLATAYVFPDSVAWQAGTRTVICEVRATSGQLTGSVRGASASASAG